MMVIVVMVMVAIGPMDMVGGMPLALGLATRALAAVLVVLFGHGKPRLLKSLG